MARSDTRYSVYPNTRAVDFLGNSAPALNRAIECWAALLTRAMADNAKKIWNPQAVNSSGRLEDMYAIQEWCVLADTLKDMPFNPDFANPGELLATAVEDANKLDDIGSKWFMENLPSEDYSRVELADKCIAELAKTLRGLDYVHAWAVFVAVQWFWEHHAEGIDIKKDEWWTLSFRRQWLPLPKVKKSSKRRTQRDN